MGIRVRSPNLTHSQVQKLVTGHQVTKGKRNKKMTQVTKKNVVNVEKTPVQPTLAGTPPTGQEQVKMAVEAKATDAKLSKEEKSRAKQMQRMNAFKLLAPPAKYVKPDGTCMIALNALLPLDKTPIPGAKEAMRQINTEHKETLATALRNGAKLPPITVQFCEVDSVPYAVVVDGYHRWNAIVDNNVARFTTKDKDGNPVVDTVKLEESLKEINLVVKPTSFKNVRDLLRASYTANFTNGLPVTQENRARYAITLMTWARQDGNKKFSMRDAAREAGLSNHAAVSRLLQKLADKAGKMPADYVNLSEEEQREVEEQTINDDAKKSVDETAKSAKAFINSAMRLADTFSDAGFIAEYLNDGGHIADNNLELLKIAAHGFLDAIDQFTRHPVEGETGEDNVIEEG